MPLLFSNLFFRIRWCANPKWNNLCFQITTVSAQRQTEQQKCQIQSLRVGKHTCTIEVLWDRKQLHWQRLRFMLLAWKSEQYLFDELRLMIKFTASTASLLLESDLVPKAESNPLGLAPYPDVTTQLRICLFLDAYVYQGILPKHTLCIKVGSQESTITIQRWPETPRQERSSDVLAQEFPPGITGIIILPFLSSILYSHYLAIIEIANHTVLEADTSPVKSIVDTFFEQIPRIRSYSSIHGDVVNIS